MKSYSTSKLVYSTTICLCLLSIGLIIQSFFIPSVIDETFYEELINMKVMTKRKQLNNDNDYVQWTSDDGEKGADFHLYEYWLYNITNPFEASTGSLPEMQSIGPFVYKRFQSKKNIRFYEDDTVVSYTYHYQYEFQPDKSTSISTNQYIWTISEAMMGFFKFINDIVGNNPMPIITCIDEALHAWPAHAIFHHDSIENFIINGYSDPYIANNSFCAHDPLWDIFEPDTRGKLAIDGDNDVAEYTGIGNIDKVRELLLYKNYSEPMTNTNKLLPGYLWPEAGNYSIEGSREIIQFPPSNYINSTSELIIFAPEKRRKINYTFDQYVQYNNIQLLRFRMNDAELNNCSITPTNCQFDQNWKMGLFNLSNLRDTPRFLSKSRFLNASTYFIERSMIRFGLNPPDPSIDDDYFDVDPISGVVFNKHQSYQRNIRMIQMDRPYPTNFTNINFFGDLVPFTNILITRNISNQETELYLRRLDEINCWKNISKYSPLLTVLIFGVIICLFCKRKIKKINENRINQSMLMEDYCTA